MNELVYINGRFVEMKVWNAPVDSHDRYFTENAFILRGNAVYNVVWAFVCLTFAWIVVDSEHFNFNRAAK